MRRSYSVSIALLLLICSAAGNEKKKPVLPVQVLNVRTAAVIIDPDAGVSPTAPMADKTAQEDVEKALTKWGRLRPVLSSMSPDLIIVVRKGNGKMTQPTVTGGGTSPNNRPVIIQPNDNGIRIGGQNGQSPDGTQSDPQSGRPQPQVGVGASEDSFVVYDGTSYGTAGDATSRAPIWRYVAKNGLKSPEVPAGEEFRKIFNETEKQQQQQRKKP
ncbi:MAG TPA: hypothetical protein VKP58_03280 [Candidatus Acidoferrum sp.]|nr:hypothetical protein [Candidatus Acidoferrum sp.]